MRQDKLRGDGGLRRSAGPERVTSRLCYPLPGNVPNRKLRSRYSEVYGFRLLRLQSYSGKADQSASGSFHAAHVMPQIKLHDRISLSGPYVPDINTHQDGALGAWRGRFGHKMVVLKSRVAQTKSEGK